jgi:DNA-binding NarL/FixJ family response regulator
MARSRHSCRRPPCRPCRFRPVRTVPRRRHHPTGGPDLDRTRRYARLVPIRIVLADDHYLVREGVAALIATEPDLDLVATCRDHDEALAAIAEHQPDVVITDIRMPPTGTDEGVRIAAQLRQERPEVGVVVLSQYVEPAYALALLHDGSAGRAYLLKERVSDIDELVAAVHAVADGGSWIDPKVVESLVTTRSTPTDSPLRHLTPRELEVLAEIATGKNNAAIAKALVLSGRAWRRSS